MTPSLRNILFLIGACFLAVGPVLMHHVDSKTVYLTGEILCALGPVLMSARAILSSPASPPDQPKVPPNDH